MSADATKFWHGNWRAKRLARTHRSKRHSKLEFSALKLSTLKVNRERKQIGVEVKKILERQESIKKSLVIEEQGHRKDLDVALRTFYCQDIKGEKKIWKLCSEIDSSHHQRKEMEDEIKRLKGEIRHVDKEILQCMKRAGGRTKLEERPNFEAELRLKRKFDLALKQYDQDLLELRHLRSEIEDTSLEQMMLAEEHDDLTRTIMRLGVQINRELEIAQEMYGKYDVARKSMLRLTQHFQKKKEDYINRMEEMDRKCKDEKLVEQYRNEVRKIREDLYSEKRNRKIEAEMNALEKEIQASGRYVMDMKIGFEEYLKGMLTHVPKESKVPMASRKTIKWKYIDLPTNAEKLRQLGALEQIQDKLGPDGLKMFIQSFIELTHENFSLYNYIVDSGAISGKLVAERRRLAEAVQRKKDEEEKRVRHFNTRKAQLDNLIQDCRQKAEQVEHKIKEADDLFQRYKDNVLRVMKNMDYTEQDIKNLIFPREKVDNEKTLNQCLAAVGQFVSAQLFAQYAEEWRVLQSRKDVGRMEENSIDFVSPTPSSTARTPRAKLAKAVIPPVLEEDDSEEEFDTHNPQNVARNFSYLLSAEPPELPLTREELKEQILHDTFGETQQVGTKEALSKKYNISSLEGLL